MWPCEEALTRVMIRRPRAECLGLDFRGRGLRSTAPPIRAGWNMDTMVGGGAETLDYVMAVMACHM